MFSFFENIQAALGVFCMKLKQLHRMFKEAQIQAGLRMAEIPVNLS